MTKEIKIIGVETIKGVSKADKPYTIEKIYFQYNFNGYNECAGCGAGSLVVPVGTIANIEVGAVRTVFSYFIAGKECFGCFLD